MKQTRKNYKVWIVLYQEFEKGWPRIAGVYTNEEDAAIKRCKLLQQNITNDEHVFIIKQTVKGLYRTYPWGGKVCFIEEYGNEETT